jgi:hypothetical protein
MNSSGMTRKEAIREFKERKTPRGIFKIQCQTNGRVWVGASRNLDAAKNGYWMGLRIGSHLDQELQREWTAQGEEHFGFEVLEILDDDVHPLALRDLLKSKQTAWRERLSAGKLL